MMKRWEQVAILLLISACNFNLMDCQPSCLVSDRSIN